MAPKFMESDMAEIEDVLIDQATNTNKANKTNLAYKVDQMHVYNVGQGTSSIILSNGIKLFASNFGYSLGTADPGTSCVFLIYGFPEIPILLSHWDTNYYRVAKSLVTKKFLGTTYYYQNRGWIIPGNKHIRGPIAINLARKINDANNLFLWPSDTLVVETSNVQVLQRMKMSPGAPSSEKIDKNNNGALALVLGSTGGCTLYPGDANFESIPGVLGLDSRVKTIITTHYGSWRFLDPRGGKVISSTIPRATSDGRVIFSYSAKNHFGYGATMTGPYYTAKGYKAVETTETLSGDGLDILEVLFKPKLR